MARSQGLKFCVLRDPADREAWRVIYNGELTAPRFNSRGAAYAYLSMLQRGQRKPEYSIDD
jgi:hypothetical protein